MRKRNIIIIITLILAVGAYAAYSFTKKPQVNYMTANLDIMTARKENVLMIPFQALKEKDGKKYVQILEGGVAKDVIVEVGLRGDIDLEILNGLKEGQEVVTFTEE